MLKNISLFCCAHLWNIIQHSKAISYLHAVYIQSSFSYKKHDSQLTSRWKFVFIVMFKSGTQKGLRDLVQEAGQIWTTGICERLQIKTLGRKKGGLQAEYLNSTTTDTLKCVSSPSVRNLTIWQWWHQWKRPWRKGFVSFETISPLYTVPSPPVTWK